jgi:hypothetical protein
MSSRNMSLLPQATLHSDSKQLGLTYAKKRRRKSHAWAPLRLQNLELYIETDIYSKKIEFP